jgi:hypothetical protein
MHTDPSTILGDSISENNARTEDRRSSQALLQGLQDFDAARSVGSICRDKSTSPISAAKVGVIRQ